MQFIRTPDERFKNLPDFPYVPNYLNISDGQGGELRVAYIDEGPKTATPIVLMHGEPSWSFLYRNMIPALLSAESRRLDDSMVKQSRLN